MKEINDKIIIYNAEDGQTKIAVRLEDDTVWLSQAQIGRIVPKRQEDSNRTHSECV